MAQQKILVASGETATLVEAKINDKVAALGPGWKISDPRPAAGDGWVVVCALAEKQDDPKPETVTQL